MQKAAEHGTSLMALYCHSIHWVQGAMLYSSSLYPLLFSIHILLYLTSLSHAIYFQFRSVKEDNTFQRGHSKGKDIGDLRVHMTHIQIVGYKCHCILDTSDFFHFTLSAEYLHFNTEVMLKQSLNTYKIRYIKL